MLELMVNQIILFAGVLQLVSASAQGYAYRLCNTLAECHALRTQVDARIKELQDGQMPVFLDIARDPNGEVKYLNWREAVYYCADQGAHLAAPANWRSFQ